MIRRHFLRSLLVLALGHGFLFSAWSQPVINEIHYDPPDPTEASEFVELFNPGTETIALGGWRLEGGVGYTFPAGTQLPAGAYLVVAQQPSTVKARFGAEALGPWTGRLGNENERVDLRDAAGGLVDRVGFQLGFPWPTVGVAPGYSIELISPGLDNELGGHWRTSVTGVTPGGGRTTLVRGQSAWRLKKGTEEASSPRLAWTTPEFDDADWVSGALPVGYDPAVSLGTPLDDMRGAYSSVYLRRRFEVADPGPITSLSIEALYDDGFRLWVNGQPLLNVNLPAGELAHDAVAGPARESVEYESFEVTLPIGLLKRGANVVTVQLLNSSLQGSSDCFFDARIFGVAGPTGRGPTPGRRNVTWSTNAPPAARQVTHVPEQPRTGDAVTVSVKVTDPDGVGSVVLRHQVVEPGAYIELTDPAYETAWVSVPMNDEGRDGDLVSGDDVYSVRLPESVQRHRRLVRYRIEVRDRPGAAVVLPYADDPQPNFAWFVYDQVPAWTGAVQPGGTGTLGEEFTVDSAEMNRLPVIHLLAKQEAVEASTWKSRYGGDAYLWQGTLVYDGRVYDHVRYRARGGVWRYAMGKNMWKFDFNRGHDFQARDDWGRKFAVGWSKLNLGASIQQGDYNHRGEQGMFESTGFRIFRLAGVPAVHSAFAQFRIIDDAEEVIAGDQYGGDFWGVYLMLEQPDGRFLEQHGMEDGNLYKMEGGGGELNHLGRAGPADGSDLNAFLGDYNGATEEWWRQNVNVPNYLSYQTVVQAIHHYDICYDKNFFYYHNPTSRQWQVVPWDLDLTWAENMFDSGCGGVDRFKERLLPDESAYPRVWREWQNRIREFRDLFWNEDEAWRLIDEQARLLRGPATGRTLLDVDRAQWDYNPKMTDPAYSSSPDSKAGNGRYYRWPNYSAAVAPRTFDGAVAVMKRYVMFRATNTTARAHHLDGIAEDPSIPARPEIRYAGPAGFPANRITLRRSGGGSAGLVGVRWRVGEVFRAAQAGGGTLEPGRYEIEAVWESGLLAPATEEVTVPPGPLLAGRTYRARLQVEDASGRTSRWSEPLEFVAGAADGTGAVSEALRISEIMYHAPSGSAADFLELHNAGTAVLDLGGASFIEGITFTMPAGTQLPAGGYLLVTKANPATEGAAFRATYGIAATVPMVGPYAGNLSDAGERLVLQAAGGATSLVTVAYSDGRGWPVAADGVGHSLVPVTGTAAVDHPGLDDARHWRASAFIGGSPGAVDPEPERPVMINEVVAHTDFLSELDSNDWVEVYRDAATPFTFGPGWYLSDDPAQLKRWAIPAGTVVPARGWLVFDEVTGFNTPRGSGFSIDKAGEQIFLSYLPATGRGAVVDAVAFKGQENDWSVARVPDGGASWDQVTPRTRGTANAALGPRVVFGEIMYHPGNIPTNELAEEFLEYVELRNLASVPVPLFNTNAVWRLNGGIEFDLPLFLTLAAGERIVVVPFDPVASPQSLAAFRKVFAVPAAVRVMGPYVGRLGNDSDRVALERAQSPDRPGDPISWVIVDEVLFADRGAWPDAADGGGQSLDRAFPFLSGQEPSSWRAAPPSPGYAATEGNPDVDGDGMPDAWERAHGLNPADPADAGRDLDGDGASNLAEYRAGTDPTVAGSVLGFSGVQRLLEGRVEAVFEAVGGRRYVVEVTENLGGGVWTSAELIGDTGSTREVRVVLGASSTGGLFARVRLVD